MFGQNIHSRFMPELQPAVIVLYGMPIQQVIDDFFKPESTEGMRGGWIRKGREAWVMGCSALTPPYLGGCGS